MRIGPNGNLLTPDEYLVCAGGGFGDTLTPEMERGLALAHEADQYAEKRVRKEM